MSCCGQDKSAAQVEDELLKASSNHAQAIVWLKLAIAALLAGLSMYLSLGANIGNPQGLARTIIHGSLAVISAFAIIGLAGPMFRSAWQSLWKKEITLEHAFLIGIIGAFSASLYSTLSNQGAIYYEVVIVLIAIYLFGQTIKSHQVQMQARLAETIPGLFGKASIVTSEGHSKISIEKVQRGDHLTVKSSETVPVDCRIIEGQVYIEQQAHTGETSPKVKAPGDLLLAGSIVLDGNIVVEATCDGNHREIDRLLRSLESSSQITTKIEALAQKVLSYFVPTVLAVALLTGIVWSLLGKPVEGWLHALTVTVVACPCALGLAIPLATRKGMTALKLLGIIPKDVSFLDRLSQVDHIAFDKTGTLSRPTLELEKLVVADDAPSELKSWIVAIQRHSTHPVARPFWRMEAEEIQPLDDLAVKTIPGRGIRANFDGKTLSIGNALLLQDQKLAAPEVLDKRSLYLVFEDKLVATAILTESARAESRSTLNTLLKDYQVSILTGDSFTPEDYQLPGLHIQTGLSSQEKAASLDATQQVSRTLYIGDGLNDCEGFQHSFASLALQSGNQAARAIAQATLLHDDLSVIPKALTTVKNLQNRLIKILLFSFAYNTIGITLAALGLLHPIVAAILMFASSIFVISFLSREQGSS